MNAKQIAALGGELRRFLGRFASCFRTRNGRSHFRTYVEGQLGPLERKSVEPIADAAGVPMRSLNQFLSLVRWDEDGARDQIQQIVMAEHSGPENIGILDETSGVKKGTETACVQRQYCGATGQVENCFVSVHLVFASGDFHTPIDSALYVPRVWAENKARCRKVHMPPDVGYRPLHEIALEQLRRAKKNSVRLDWVTADERYAEVPAFLTALEDEGLHYVLEVPKGFSGWTQRPPVRAGDEEERLPRIAANAPRPVSVASLVERGGALAHKPFTAYHIKDTFKGPDVWEVRECPFFQHRDGRVSQRLRLLHVRNVLAGTEKFFITDAPPSEPVETLLRVAFSRWRVERSFEDCKGQIGFDHFEVRGYPSIKRHMVLSMVSHLFLAAQKERLRGGKSARHGLPSEERRRCAARRAHAVTQGSSTTA